MRSRVTGDAGPADTALVFDMPVSVALMLSFLFSRWIYPQPPRLLWAILGAFAFLPSVIILRRLFERDLYPILYGLVVFYFLDQLRAVAAAIQYCRGCCF